MRSKPYHTAAHWLVLSAVIAAVYIFLPVTP